jgi:pilus assembly protein CpaC
MSRVCCALVVLLLGGQMFADPPTSAQRREAAKDSPKQVQLDVVVAQLRDGLVLPQMIAILSSQDTQFLRSCLDLLRATGLVKLMAEPRLVTISGRHASFLDGGEQAVPVPAGLGSVGVQFEEFGTRHTSIKFHPTVLGKDKIRLEVDARMSACEPGGDKGRGELQALRGAASGLSTTVELDAGRTLMLSGPALDDLTGKRIKIPILSDLPFIGSAFTWEAMNSTLILATPHLVDSSDAGQAPKALPGQDTRSPDDFELFLEGVLEAPRGPRDVSKGKAYVPACKDAPAHCPCPDGRCGEAPRR